MRILSRLLAVVAFSALLPLSAHADGPATLTVTGTAVVEVAPDLATISLGVTTNGATAAAAMAANNDALSAVLARIRAAGIEDRDMQTSNLSLNPNWVTNPAGTTNEIQGYIATNMLTIRVRAMDQTGAVLDAAISDGANSLNGLSFGLQNQRPQEDEARKQAVADAIARATLIAGAAGTKLGPILSIAEGGMAEPMPGPMYRMADAKAVPIAGGSVEVSASVTIVFKLGE
ncbi:MAG: SIMPL domain-containing protein [bacterium]